VTIPTGRVQPRKLLGQGKPQWDFLGFRRTDGEKVLSPAFIRTMDPGAKGLGRNGRPIFKNHPTRNPSEGGNAR